MFEKTFHAPAYGPQGQPLCVLVTWGGRRDEYWFWSQEAALEARDYWLDRNVSVRVLGLPTTIAGGGIGDVLDGRD